MIKRRNSRKLFSMQLSLMLFATISQAFQATSNLSPAFSMSTRSFFDRRPQNGFSAIRRGSRQHQNMVGRGNTHRFLMFGDELTIGPSIDGGYSSLSPHFNSIPFLDEEDPHMPLHNLLKKSSTVLTTTTINPDLEAEALTDLAHVGLDFSSFFTPSKSMIRVFSLMGRVLLLLADYIPDHVIRPEELAIQIFMMAVSMSDLVKISRQASTRKRMNQNEER